MCCYCVLATHRFYDISAELLFLDGHTRYGVFCLFRVGNQVMDTPTLIEVDRNTMDIIFKDTVIL